jgi:hypothetical protein
MVLVLEHKRDTSFHTRHFDWHAINNSGFVFEFQNGPNGGALEQAAC